MRTIPIICNSNLQKAKTFKGTIKYLDYDSTHKLVLKDTPTQVGLEKSANYTQNIQSISPKFAKVYNAFSDYHSGRTGRVYVGDPDEKIDFKKVFQSADYAIEDMEPRYPDVDKQVSVGYFFKDDTRYDEHYKAISDFHDRREAAAKKFEQEYREKIKEGINVKDSQEKLDYYIWQQGDSFYKGREAKECLDIYNKAESLKKVKAKQGSELGDLQRNRADLNRKIEEAQNRINAERQANAHRLSIINSIEKRKDLYNQIAALPEETANEAKFQWSNEAISSRNLRLSIFENEQLKIETYMPEYEGMVSKIKNVIENGKKIIADNKRLIEGCKKSLNVVQELIKNKEADLAATKSKLIPLFDELKAFYVKHGLMKRI